MHAHARIVAAVAFPTAILVLATSGIAQAGTRGVLAGAPVAILVDGGVPGSADTETRVHRNGFTLAPTAPLPTGGADLRVIFALHGLSSTVILDVDDISTGRDDVTFTSNGWLAVPSMSWGVLSFSVKSGAVGIPASGTNPASRIAQQAAEGDVGATLFSWVLPGSVLPPQLVGTNVVERSHSRAELGLPAGGSSAVEVDGLDVPLVLGLDQNSLAGLEPGFSGLIANPPAIYFTVSHATRNAVPGPWWRFNGQPTLPSGASILRTERIGASWTAPTVFQPYWLLNLGQDEDIDGLAYDALRDKLLISCVGTSRDQFLFYDMVVDLPTGPMDAKQADGATKVSASVGKAQADDIDAICTLDPRIGTASTPPPAGEDFGSSCGTPVPAVLGPPSVHASAFRRFDSGLVFYDTWAIGWPPVTGQGPGLAAMFLTFGSSLTLNLWSPIFVRNPSNPLIGDPQRTTINVPLTVALTNLDVTVRWLVADSALTEIAEAWPVRLFL